MQLLNKLVDPGADVYYSLAFRNMIEDHLQWLITNPTSAPITIEPGIAYKYAGDLEGVLRYQGVSNRLHWIIMRMNAMTSPSDYRDTMLQLHVPEPSVIERLRSGFAAQTKLGQRKK